MMKTESTRVAFTEGLMELAKEDPNVVLVCSDSMLVIRAQPFIKAYPDRFFETGIAEQNAVACAAGLASCGLTPFFATYAGFITMRACEQVRTFIAYPGLNVKLIGANGGMASGEREGVTHQFFEDLGIMRTIPGITVVVPADASQVKQAVKAVARIKGPAYIRIGSGRDPVVFDNYEPFKLGKIRILKESGKDAALFTNGFVINRVLKAAEILEREGIRTLVAEVHTLKPLDVESIVQILGETRAAVTVEDHNIIGGLGSAIAEVIAEEIPVPLVRVGLRDIYPESGRPEELLDHYGIGVADIVNAVKKVVKRKGSS
ncbi:MAG TPA: transketolase [Clostridiaceae bacterium]|nr:transketolase [Clostridiaceae bacterium]